MLYFLFFLFLILTVLGVPVAVAIGSACFATLSIDGTVNMTLVAQKMITQMSSFTMTAIPLFMLTGEIMTNGGITRALINFADSLVGWVRGGLSYATIVAGMLMGGISGSGPADTAALGSIMIPTMEESGYPRSYAAAIQAGSGSIGAIIPPSISMIVLAGLTTTSVGKLFMGGVLPGILIGLFMIVASYFSCRHYGFGLSDQRAFTWKRVGQTFVPAIIPLMIPVIIVGGILSGIFTATESAAVAVLYTFIVGTLVYKSIKFKNLEEIFVNAAVGAANVLMIIGICLAFSWIMTRYNFAAICANFLSTVSSNVYVVLILINIIFLVGGCFMEGCALMTMLVPTLYPIIIGMGYNGLVFCMLIQINQVLGSLTPPVGVCTFVAASIAKEPLGKVAKYALPGMLCMVVVMLLIVLIPGLVTWLPSLMS